MLNYGSIALLAVVSVSSARAITFPSVPHSYQQILSPTPPTEFQCSFTPPSLEMHYTPIPTGAWPRISELVYEALVVSSRDPTNTIKTYNLGDEPEYSDLDGIKLGFKYVAPPSSSAKSVNQEEERAGLKERKSLDHADEDEDQQRRECFLSAAQGVADTKMMGGSMAIPTFGTTPHSSSDGTLIFYVYRVD